MLPNFARVPVPGDMDSVLTFLRQLQDNITDAIRRLVQPAIIDGRQVSGVALPANTATPVGVALGRPILGWWVTDINVATAVFRVPSPIGGQLVLQAPVACVISVWVY